MAGGYTQEANKKIVAIRRFTKDNDASTLYVDPNKLDIVLRPNDVVYVSERSLAKGSRFFERVGQILKPFTDSAFTAGMLRSF